jgi:hypothetical protein
MTRESSVGKTVRSARVAGDGLYTAATLPKLGMIEMPDDVEPQYFSAKNEQQKADISPAPPPFHHGFAEQGDIFAEQGNRSNERADLDELAAHRKSERTFVALALYMLVFVAGMLVGGALFYWLWK